MRSLRRKLSTSHTPTSKQRLSPLKLAILGALGASASGCIEEQVVGGEGGAKAGTTAGTVAGLMGGITMGGTTTGGTVTGGTTTGGTVTGGTTTGGTVTGGTMTGGTVTGGTVTGGTMTGGTTGNELCESSPNLNAEGAPNGYLSCPNDRLFKIGPAQCSGGCVTDDGCNPGQSCVCVGDEPGRCVTSYCGSGESCGTGLCEFSSWDDGCGLNENLSCRTEEDRCVDDSSCEPGSFCSTYGDSVWSCRGFECAVGRPSIVDEQTLTSPLEARSGWGAPRPTLRAALDQLSDEEREALEGSWREVAALEHSSVASFARATLELMAVGAPADLLLETQRAAADEVQHAQEVYSWLSTLKGELVGPGAFPSAPLAPRQDRRALALSLAREACLGETLGVSEVSAARELVEAHQGPSVIAEHLATVEADETRHAALAWRTLAWLLQGADEALLSEVSGVFVSGVSELLAELPQGVRARRVSPALSALGLLSPAQVHQARLQAAHEVLLPALVTLLGAPHAMRAARELSRLALPA